MKLIKCPKCGRPFYNDNDQCPYCSQDSNAPLQQPSNTDYVEPAAEVEEPPAVSTAVTPEPPAVAKTDSKTISRTISERAEIIALVSSQNTGAANTDMAEEPNTVETEPVPPKRHPWRWILAILIIALLATLILLHWNDIKTLIPF
jgi:uncharacterized OB-fold protein